MKDKVIFISGGTGSLGQELVRQLLKCDIQSIRIFSNEEYPQYMMADKFNDTRLRFLIGDVRDKGRLYRAMNGVDFVIHAAALKQVPLCEYNPIEAIKTNIMGSINIVDAAIDSGVEKILAISSDKAVHPINLYGATKLVMEKLFIQANVYGKAKFSCVRFGNFSESRGNVASLVKKQLDAGEIITITDKEMARFWITLEDAARFTINCISMMRGKEIFIPKMGERRTIDVIEAIAPNAPRKIIGKRQGEKLVELLWSEDESNIIKDEGNYYVIGR